MRYFLPVSDELLFSDTEMQRYRLVPYDYDCIPVRSLEKCLEQPKPPASFPGEGALKENKNQD